jgi:hypothetical protein
VEYAHSFGQAVECVRIFDLASYPRIEERGLEAGGLS